MEFLALCGLSRWPFRYRILSVTGLSSGASNHIKSISLDIESPLENNTQFEKGQRMEVILKWLLVYSVSCQLTYNYACLSPVFPFYTSFPLSPAELQAAVCIHSDPAPVAKHSEGFLETGAGLPLHIHSNAQRRWPSPGKPDLIMCTWTHRHILRHKNTGGTLQKAHSQSSWSRMLKQFLSSGICIL